MSKTHIGQNVQRVRVYLGVKQDALADELGITQQEVSKIEKQEFIDERMLLNIADALCISPEVIRNFDLERAIKNICNSDYEATVLGRKSENEDELQLKMVEKIFELYERLLKSEREKIELLTLKKNN
jgi:transcriptional regulator with XRE-family HTH domain